MLFATLAAAALAGSAVARPTPAHWKSDILENYQVYHLRYVALNCSSQHNTSFFEDCCRPIRANQNATIDLEPFCQPNETAIAFAEAKIAAANATNTAQISATASADPSDDSGEQFAAASSTATQSASETATDSAAETPVAAAADVSPSSSTETVTATADNSKQTQADNENQDSTTSSSSSSSSSTSSEQPQQTQESNSDSGSDSKPAPSGGDISGGQGTFYSQGGSAGACGQFHSDSDLVVAASTAGQYYPNPNAVSPYCGRQVRISRADGKGNTVVATIADACPSCGNGNDLDLSKGTYAAINGDNAWGEGRFPIVWSFA